MREYNILKNIILEQISILKDQNEEMYNNYIQFRFEFLDYINSKLEEI